MPRISGLLLSFAFGSMIALAGTAGAQPFPTRQITLLVGFPPGGGTDGPSRIIADRMRASLGVPVVVENRPGGQQMVAIRAVQASPPDGYTLLVGTGSSLAQNPSLNPAIGYDPLRDFTLIAQFGVSQGVIVVHSSVPVQTLQELVAYLRKNPGQSYATGGVGAAAHLSMSLLTSKLGLEMVHVPYKGDGPAMVDLASGRVPIGMMSYISARGAGDKVRILAATSVARLPVRTRGAVAVGGGAAGAGGARSVHLLRHCRSARHAGRRRRAAEPRRPGRRHVARRGVRFRQALHRSGRAAARRTSGPSSSSSRRSGSRMRASSSSRRTDRAKSSGNPR